VDVCTPSTKSPRKKTEQQNSRVINLQADEYSYTLDQLSLAKVREPRWPKLGSLFQHINTWKTVSHLQRCEHSC
jgi:hypothetical protein